ncbi:hypothetical protein AB0K60_03700 [Thermopolyspora sp. NPDC052614]|uniref:hypothetical protein n=1 Tax=Thermopolyspora sp. NPDC052614 TaxID=3155682 RepID=UPI00341E64FF
MAEETRTAGGQDGEANRGGPSRNHGLATWQLLLPIIAPMTIITALIVYFGYIRVSGKYNVFGLTSDVLDLSLQDYMFYGPDITFRPLLWALIPVVILGPGYALLISKLAAHPKLARRAAWGARALGVVGCLVGFLGSAGLMHIHINFPVVPLSIFIGALSLALAVRLQALGGHHVPKAEAPSLYTFWTLALVAMLALSLCWAGAIYMQKETVEAVYQMDLRRLPSVVVYAPERLHIEGTGVAETVLAQRPGQTARYRFRYEGLRLLIHTNNRYFMIPVCYGEDPKRRVITLPDDNSIRMDFPRPSDEPAPVCS